MPIQENAINSALAEVIAKHGYSAEPEATILNCSKRCDVLVREKHGGQFFTAIECKVGQSTTKRKAAIQDAKRWFNLAPRHCWNAVAFCYPERLKERSDTRISELIEKADDLWMVKVGRKGVEGPEIRGGVDDLLRLINDVGSSDAISKVINVLYGAIKEAGDIIDRRTGKRLADVLDIPWKEKVKGKDDPRPARIASLIIANTILLQERLHQNQQVAKLDSLAKVCNSKNKKKSLTDNWKRIQAKDYVPVVGPALRVLSVLSSNNQDTEDALEILTEAVAGCADRVRTLQLDHAGPIYHSLLETAKYEGSFYTSTVAAVLLAELAIPQKWSVVNSEWNNFEKLSKLVICDPACGTGTLLMASARIVQERGRKAGGNEQEIAILYQKLIENSLHGFDINHHAIHLAASMLTISAPKIDYDKMHLYNMKHGVDKTGEVRAGSLDILIDNAGFLPGLELEHTQRRAKGAGYEEEAPGIKGKCDLVIMNPPFTRSNLNYRSLPEKIRNRVTKHKKYIAEMISDPSHKEAIDQSTLFSFFGPIADQLLNDRGTLAIIQPVAACLGPAAAGYRKLMTDSSRFHLEAVITSHDNSRVYFSENTTINECLVIARRAAALTKKSRTAFISLKNNPATTNGAHLLAEVVREAIIQNGKDGEVRALPNYGVVVYKSMSNSGKPWREAAFYDVRLVRHYEKLLRQEALDPLSKLAWVRPAGQGVRQDFETSDTPNVPDMRALWDHKSERQVSMKTTPDTCIHPKKDRVKQASAHWDKRGYLLIANRFRTNLVKTPAVFSEERILGSAFIPVTPQVAGDVVEISKAWCVWFNSSFGVLAFLNERTKQLDYPRFSLEGQRALPAPIPSKCDIAHLASVFDKVSKRNLQALPEIQEDSVRKLLDEAVIAAVPGLVETDLAELKLCIAREPSVHNKTEEEE